ncbi:hypothetical protein HYALB_00009297 [Hymenoscyphus albidus]|uniref:Nucleoside phosphorylase domain-containing protein n=1 Tax=Hymenoscyphus albidus TaxID=595503 RepID=A0A9N9LNG7_9HELO|nr:hypothetical protein HYALB_00009297 [Hymenoscyphus albidus]
MASSSTHSGQPASENEQRDFPPTSYTVGWISALPTESIAAQSMLDERHKSPETRNQHDSNTYILGRVGKHNVVMACLDDYGPTRAAMVASNMMSAFPNVRFGLMVGIGGGIPSKENDIRLGDIVVSKPTGEHGGVVQYDLGKMEKDEFHRLDSLNKPPPLLRTAVNALKTRYDFETQISERATTAFKFCPKWEKMFLRPLSQDRLFGPDYEHVSDNQTCEECDRVYELLREERPDPAIPEIHYGKIASGGSVIKKASDRDHLGKRDNAICFDMEAAGLMDDFPCLVVRGICDYSDSHKNKNWQPYAAAVAAAYAKELLLQIPPEAVKSLRPIQNVHWIVPKSVNPFFTGRERILRELRGIFANLAMRKTPCINVSSSMALVVLGKASFWGVFWIDATTEDSIRRGMICAAQRAFNNSSMNFEDAKTEFSNFEYSWLLILDNADNPEINYEQYFPTGNTGNIIMTTRNHDCIKYGTAGHETFEKLDLEDAVELLLKSSGIKKEYRDENEAEASNVVQLLVRHALAITQAGATINQGICNLPNYSKFLTSQQKELLSDYPTQSQSTYGSVYATSEVSVQAMQRSKKSEWKDALALLQILGYFYRDNLSEEIFSRAWDYALNISTWQPHDLLTHLSMWHVHYLRRILPPQASNRDEALMSFGRARQVLRSFSLVSFDPQTSAI